MDDYASLESQPGHAAESADCENKNVADRLNRGKGKASMIVRLEASTKLAIKSFTSDQTLPDIATATKPIDGSSSLGRKSSFTGMTRHGVCSSKPSQAFKGSQTYGETSQNFNEFSATHANSPVKEHWSLDDSLSLTCQETCDGADVVRLMSEPDEPDNFTLELFQSLSPTATIRLQDALFKKEGQQRAWDKLLDFSPDFFAQPDTSESGRLWFGTTDIAVARGIWLQRWSEVLSGYNHQVWGELEGFKTEAITELNAIALNNSCQGVVLKTKALQRLVDRKSVV